jgi:hypothetical protein
VDSPAQASDPSNGRLLHRAAAPVAVDQSGRGSDGTYLGGVELGVPGALLAPNTAARFDGANDILEMGDRFDFVEDTPFSIEVWIRPRADDFDGVICAKSRYTEGIGYQGWLLVLHDTGGTLTFYRVPGDSLTGPRPPEDVWSHVVVTYDGFTILLYIDGEEVASLLASGRLVDTEAPFQVAGGANWGSLATDLDELAVYDAALPPRRIRAHYAAVGGE